MMTTDCKNCQDYLPDLLLDAQAVPASVPEHLAGCAACDQEMKELRATFVLLDEWVAPEPSAFFDARMHARLREAQVAAPEGLWERLTNFVRFSTGLTARPALAGALGIAMLLGGGTAATLLTHHGATPTASSPTVDDLKIYDNNAQAVDQMDLLDDPASTDTAPRS